MIDSQINLLRLDKKCKNNCFNGNLKICCDSTCRLNPVICGGCNSNSNCKSQNHLKSMEESLSFFSYELGKVTSETNDVFMNFSQKDMYLKSLYENSPSHIKKMEDHIISQKIMIAEDIANLMGTMSDVMQQIKNEFMKKIDDYFTNYKENVQTFKNLMDSGFSSLKFKFYNNPNNLAAKMIRTNGDYFSSFISDLKKAIEGGKETISNKEHFIKNLKSSSDHIIHCSQNLPVYSPINPISNQSDELKKNLNLFLEKSLTFPKYSRNYSRSNSVTTSNKENTPTKVGMKVASKLTTRYKTEKEESSQLRSRSRSTSRQPSQYSSSRNLSSSFSILAEGKHLIAKNLPNELRLRITNSIKISESLDSAIFLKSENIAYCGQNSPYLRIIGTENGELIDEVKHNDHILGLLKIDSNDKMSNSQINNPTTLITSTKDKELYIWNFDKKIALKQRIQTNSIITFFTDLNDREHVLCGDLDGNILVINYLTGKIFSRFDTSHKDRIVDIKLVQNNQKFIIASKDNTISVWNINYTLLGAKYCLDSIYCSKVYVDNFKGITSIGIPYEDCDLIVICTCSGNLILFDLQKRIFLADIQAHKYEIPECILLCENNIDEKSFVIITSSLYETGLKFWGCFLRKGGNFDGPIELASFSEMSISGSELKKNKISMTKGQNPQLMVVNGNINEITIGEIIFN